MRFSKPNVVSSVQQSSLRMLPYWIAAACTAVVAVGYAKAFAWAESLSMQWFAANSAWVFLLTPLAMLTSFLIAHFYSPSASGSGIPQIIAALEVSREPGHPLFERLVHWRMILAKLIGSCVCVAGGGVTGREGPMLQVSAGLFNYVMKFYQRFFRTYAPNAQSMVLAGGAAGLASAFNTPLGGVIFAVEELAKTHISSIRTYVFHAVIIAGILAQAMMGNYLYFGRIKVVSIQPQEILPLMFGMALIGALGALFGRGCVTLSDLRGTLSLHWKVTVTIVFGLLVASLSFFFGTSALGGGRHVITELLTREEAAPYWLPLVRGFGNFFTYNGGVIGGIFAPALATGASLGSWMSEILPGFNHQLWILAGMAAFLTGVTRTPFTSLILVLEMTDTHDVIIYLMLAAIIAQGAARFVQTEGFYELMAKRLLQIPADPPVERSK